MTDPQAVFAALADPTRRRVLDRLVSSGPASATVLSGEFPMTRQAVAKHLTVLEEAGLVERRVVGRETRFEATPDPLGDVSSWIEAVGDQWEQRLERLRRSMS